MTQLIIIAHAPLASALVEVGKHAFPEAAHAVQAFDVTPNERAEQTEDRLRTVLAQHPEALLLVDVFGGTPGNIAARFVDGTRVRLVYGASVPMLWRTLNYRNRSLAELADLAVSGAVQGVIAMASSTRPQNQSNLAAQNDSFNAQDQQ
ncbi:MAG: PTS sugar transporter subunit IIA [Rubrivivax sp.]|jgi:PTS system mannose-specific IIA component|nr:PTS fructose transporter subunit IIA [Rubrivivax sp.]